MKVPFFNYQEVYKKYRSDFLNILDNVGSGGATGKAQALFGDFSKVHLAQFGGLDLLYDPYTKSRQGLGTLIATTLVDGAATQNALAFGNLIEA